MSYEETVTTDGGFEICYYKNLTSKFSWETVNPLPKSVPLFILQLAVNIFFSIIFRQVLKHRQPHFVSQIAVGILLGPSGIGMKPLLTNIIAPFSGILVLETLANLALVFYMFLVGLEMNIAPALRCGKKVISISIAGWIIPGILGAFIYWLLEHKSPAYNNRQTYLGFVFWPIALMVTSFPDLAKIIASLKLFHTKIGRIALSSALINDAGGWVLLSSALVLNSFILHRSVMNVFTSVTVFVLIVYGISPAFLWAIRRVAKDEKYNDHHLCFVLIGAILCGLLSDSCGDHSIVGAFLFGLLIPSGPLNSMLKHRLEGYVTEIMMPAFFFNSGLRANIFRMVSHSSWIVVVIVVVIASMAKILSTVLTSKISNISIQEGFALGVLLNTKGVLVLVIMNTAITIKAIGVESFTVMLIAVLIMTCMVEPLMALTYKPLKRFNQYKDRTIETSAQDTEFRILFSIHSIRNISGLINLLEVSNPTPKSPIAVFAVQLVELTGRDSALQIIQEAFKPESSNSATYESESDQIFHILSEYEHSRHSLCVQPLATASPYSTMHRDIITLAEEKRSHIIILPFQKPSEISIRNVNTKIKAMNRNVMEKAPCSVGIFVDHGHTFTDEETMDCGFRRVAMFFLGGPDDREALSYAWRMSGHQSVELTVVRFVLSSDSSRKERAHPKDDGGELLQSRNGTEKLDDNDYILEFRYHTMNNQRVWFYEKEVKNGDETLTAIREMGRNYELFIVGRGKGVTSKLISGLSDWNDYPELGFLGETLATADFAQQVSVLVVQQYGPPSGSEHGSTNNTVSNHSN